jgi:DNA-binding response OmpR family regulator
VHPSQIVDAAREQVERTVSGHTVETVIRGDTLVRLDARSTAAPLAHLLENAARYSPDLIVLDLGRPDIEGTEVCRRVRDRRCRSSFCRRAGATRTRCRPSIWAPTTTSRNRSGRKRCWRDQPEHLWVLVAQLRKKIEVDPAAPRYLISEPWVGYRLATEASSRSE